MLVVNGGDVPNEAQAGSSVAPEEQAEVSVDKPENTSTPSSAGEQQPSEQYVFFSFRLT